MTRKPRRSKEYEELDRKNRFKIYKRDRRMCFMCEVNEGVDIHEIIPRNEFGDNYINDLFSDKNRCLLCRKCHTNQDRWDILNKMKRLYGYDYSEYPWNLYFDDSQE